MYSKVIYTKIKNTLSALTLALGIVGFGFSVGEPASAVPLDIAVASVSDRDATQDSSADVVAPSTSIAPRRSQSLKRHLAMPFISFSPLLPRRGV